MNYEVKRPFAHIRDEEFLYTEGQPFPRKGATVEATEEELKKLKIGKFNKPYIIDKDAKEVNLEELDAKKSNKADLLAAAEAKGVEVNESMTKPEIVEAIKAATETPEDAQGAE